MDEGCRLRYVMPAMGSVTSARAATRCESTVPYAYSATMVFLSQRGFAEEDKVVVMWRRPLCAGWYSKYVAVVRG